MVKIDYIHSDHSECLLRGSVIGLCEGVLTEVGIWPSIGDIQLKRW